MEPQFTTKDLFEPFKPVSSEPVQPSNSTGIHDQIIVHADGLDIDMSSDSHSDHEDIKMEKESKNPDVKADPEQEDNEPASYAKFKTPHELDPDAYYNEDTIPKIPQLAPTDVLNCAGIIESVLDNKCLLNADMSIGILDLDNVLYSEKRNCIGFIDDVLGPVNKPFYSVFFYPRPEGMPEKLEKGQKLYTPLKSQRLVSANAIKEKPGCDASNIYDEEISEGEMEYSDDEKESQAKKERKKKKRPTPELSQTPTEDYSKKVIPSQPAEFKPRPSRTHNFTPRPRSQFPAPPQFTGMYPPPPPLQPPMYYAAPNPMFPQYPPAGTSGYYYPPMTMMMQMPGQIPMGYPGIPQPPPMPYAPQAPPQNTQRYPPPPQGPSSVFQPPPPLK